MPIISRIIEDRADWLQWRRRDVTASTVGALFDCHPYCTALRLYAEKRGTEFPEPEDNKTMRRGRWLEPAVARAVEELRPEWEFVAGKIYNSDPDLRLGATPDYFIIRKDNNHRGVLQIKSVAPNIFARDWQDGPPLWIILQAATEMMLCDGEFGAVAALTVDPHAMDCHVFDIPKNPAAEARIIERVKEFWRDVELGNEPQPDFARDRDVIRALHPQEIKGRAIDLSGHNELPDMLARRALLRDQIKAAEAACKAIEGEVMFLMGEAEAATGINGWKINYKSQTRSGYTVPEKTMRVLTIYDRRDNGS